MDVKYLKKVGLYILSVALALTFIVYLVYHLMNGFTTDISTIAAEIQSNKSVLSGDGYIFRNEHCLYSSYGGAVGYLVGDGEKISINQPIAEIFSDSASYSTRTELAEIEDKLAVLRESEIPQNSAKTDTSTVDKRISSYYHLILKNISEGKFSHAIQSTDSLLTQMNRRQIIIGERTDFSSVKSSLELQKANLTSKLTGLSETIYSDTSGYFFFNLDGYENAFSSDAIDNMTVSSFYELISTSPKSIDGTNGAFPIGKIATGYKWYIALPTTEDRADEIQLGQKYKCVFPYNYDTELTLTAEKVLTEASGEKAVAIFSCKDMPESFSYLRSQPIEVVLAESEGYRVPKTAVRIVDGYEGVYTLYGSTVVFKRIDIILEVEGNYIVSTTDPLEEKDSETATESDLAVPEQETTDDKQQLKYKYLNLYDRIITAGKDLNDGMVFY